MKLNRNKTKVTRLAAIRLTMNTNGVSREIAERYTDSELREVVRLLRLKPAF